jgi:hypothetical protein
MQSIIVHIANRFKEPSSWAGISGLAILVGYHLDASVAQSIALVGAGLAGLIAFFVPEQS